MMKRLIFLIFLLLFFPAPATARAAQPAEAALRLRAAEKLIVVRIGEQSVTAYEDGAEAFTFSVSTGRNGNTALGRFRIRDKLLAPRHAQWNYTMPHWMGVYWVGRGLENGFHALPVLPDGSRLWAAQIGTPASDGCIVLRPADMRRLYDWAEIGTPVMIEP